MLERSCFHIDREAPKTHKNGWSFFTFHAKTTVPGYEAMTFKACDLAHAEKQARAFTKKHGGTVIEIKGA